jgi:hypothetical protein
MFTEHCDDVCAPPPENLTLAFKGIIIFSHDHLSLPNKAGINKYFHVLTEYWNDLNINGRKKIDAKRYFNIFIVFFLLSRFKLGWGGNLVFDKI